MMKFLVLIVFSFLSFGVAHAGDPAKKIGTLADGQKAEAALNDILRAYGNGDVNYIREHLDSSMIGYQSLLDGVVLENNQCKQMRVRLLDTQTQAGPDLVVIQSNWEKRCLQLPGMTAKLFTGHSTFLMHLGSNGWGITAISGVSPLAQSLSVR